MTEDKPGTVSPPEGEHNEVPEGVAAEARLHWLVRPGTIRQLWILFVAILALTVAGDFFVKHKDHFGIESTFGFGAWFGFIACVIFVLGSKALGFILKRPDTYYDN